MERARSKGVELVGPGGLLSGLTKTELETADLDKHLDYPKHAVEGRNSGKSRSGTRSETVLTEVGEVELERVVRVYADHYDSHRPRRSRDLAPPPPDTIAAPRNRCRRETRSSPRSPGGLIHEYRIAASPSPRVRCANILVKAGLPPAPRCAVVAQLPAAHGELILACDFFTVDTSQVDRFVPRWAVTVPRSQEHVAIAAGLASAVGCRAQEMRPGSPCAQLVTSRS